MSPLLSHRSLARALYVHDYHSLPSARAAEAVYELFGCAKSAGTLPTAVRRCAAALLETELKIRQGLWRSLLTQADGTGLRVIRKLGYAHVAGGTMPTHYAAGPEGTRRFCRIRPLPVDDAQAKERCCRHSRWRTRARL